MFLNVLEFCAKGGGCPCPSDPQFPKLEDYELVFQENPSLCGLVKGVTDETATLRTAVLAACRVVAHLLRKSPGN